LPLGLGDIDGDGFLVAVGAEIKSVVVVFLPLGIDQIRRTEGTRVVARISELSSRGCYVDTVNPFPEGTKLSIRIRYGCSTCQLSGKVIYTHTGYGMGVHFADIAKENRTTLDAWLEELAWKSN